MDTKQVLSDIMDIITLQTDREGIPTDGEIIDEIVTYIHAWTAKQHNHRSSTHD